MDARELFRRSAERFADNVSAVGEGQWDGPTPCTEWSVRDLVNHVTSENSWAVPLLQGATLEEVGDRFDGDLLGESPTERARAAAAAAAEVATMVPEGTQVHLSFGLTPAEEYLHQIGADNLVHGWDLAAAVGADTTLDPELVDAVAEWFADNEEAWRAGGALGPRLPLTGEAQHDLLARFGRDAGWSA